MTEHLDLRDKARRAIREGKLPAQRPRRAQGGPGNGAICSLCSEPVKYSEMELEIEIPRPDTTQTVDRYRFHPRCFHAWEVERDNADTRGPIEGYSS